MEKFFRPALIFCQFRGIEMGGADTKTVKIKAYAAYEPETSH